MDQEYTLEIAIEDYLDHLEEAGKSSSTIGTAKRTMALLQQHLGDSKVISKILPVHVAGFYNSGAATTQEGKDGPKPRAKQSILQIRRIVRDALVYWHTQGHLENVPLTKDEKKFLKTDKPPKVKTPQIAPPLPPEAYVHVPDADPEPIPTQPQPEQTTTPTQLAEPTEPATDTNEPDTENTTPAESMFVTCHKKQQRRAAQLCQQNGCVSKAAAKKCEHWQRWLAEGTV